jgi:hypothetical protein
MPYTHTVEGRIVHIVWSGVVSKEDLQSLGEDLPRFAAELGFAPDLLHNFDAVTGYGFQPIAAYMLSLVRKRLAIAHPVKSASVAKTPELRRMVQIFKTLNRTHNLTMEIFDSEEAARRWLGEQSEGSE